MSEYELPAKGDYWGVPTAVYLDKSPKQQTQNITVEFETSNMIVPINEEETEYVSVAPIEGKMYFYMSEKAVKRSMEDLKGIGLCGNFQDGLELKPEQGGFIIECKHEEYDGKTYARWGLPYDVEITDWTDQEKLSAQAEFGHLLDDAPAQMPEEAPVEEVEPTPDELAQAEADEADAAVAEFDAEEAEKAKKTPPKTAPPKTGAKKK